MTDQNLSLSRPFSRWIVPALAALMLGAGFASGWAFARTQAGPQLHVKLPTQTANYAAE